MENVYIGRQPIFDRGVNVIGYELLYRSGDMDRAVFLDGNHATSTVISNTFMEIGLDTLVGDKLAFINLTREFVLGQYPIPPRHDRLVLEVLEDIELDDEVIAALRNLKDQGFTLALDDVVDIKDVKKVVDMAHIVKIDLMRVDMSKLAYHVKKFKKYDVQLLAEKVENKEVFDLCKDLGFDLFQGFFLSKPNIIKEKKLSNSRVAVLSLLARLQDPEIEFSEIDQTIKRDVSLSYKLLRLINSAYYARSSEIKSIKQALTLLGLKQIRSWVSLLLLTKSDDKPPELVLTAMIRGRMGEMLAKAAKLSEPESFFTVGLFSVLDALMDMDLKEILEKIPLSPDIKNALTDGTGKHGEALNCILAYEKGLWEEVQFSGLAAEDIKKCYLDSLEWSREISNILKGEG